VLAEEQAFPKRNANNDEVFQQSDGIAIRMGLGIREPALNEGERERLWR
jgi:hypothetical protein